MKVKVMAVVIASVLAGNVFAAAPEAERAAFEQRYVLIDSGVATIDNVRAAILSSYVKNNGWPSINSLVTDKYLATTAASWGSNTSGMANAGGNSYTLALPTPSADIAQGIASKVGGVAAGSSVQVTMPIPAAAAINASNLSRVAVPSNPDANKMFTNINMNNNALQNVSQIDAIVLNASTAKLGSVTVETALDVIPDATFRRNVNILGDVKTTKVDTQSLIVAGGVNIGGNTVSTGDITGKNLISNNDVVAGGQVRAQSAVFNGGVIGDSAKFKLGEFESLSTKNHTVTNMFIAKGASEFYQDALFRGSVNVNGALTVGGIASALDIREGGMLLKDKYAQLAAANIFTKENTFTQAIAANGGITVDGKTAISADGSTLYESGVAISTKYLGKGDKAVSAGTADLATRALNADNAGNADKLDNLDSAAFAQRGVANTFTQANTFNGDLYANNGVIVDGKWVISADGSTLYESGVAISAKYLGKGDKAVSAGTADIATRALNADNATNANFAGNADKLDNLDSTAFAQRNADNTMTGVNTFVQAIRADGGIMVDGKWIASADGNTLYEGGTALSAKYLGINDKAKSAADSDKLGGVGASSYARKDIAETFTQAVTLNKGVTVDNEWLRINGQYGLYFQSYGGGWNMTDSTWIRAYGGKSIFTSGMVQADGGVIVGGKWIASADGNTLYEGGTALNAKYLGINDKAKSAADSDKLGGVAASTYARKDVANSFSGLQTFNGGIRSVGTSLLDAVTVNNNLTVNGDILFKDATGTTRTMKDTYSKVTSLETWKTACQRDMTSPACGMSLPENTGGGSSNVWTGTSKRVTNLWGTGYFNHTVKSPWGVVSGNAGTDGVTTLVQKGSVLVREYVDAGNSETALVPKESYFYLQLESGAFVAYYYYPETGKNNWETGKWIKEYYDILNIAKL